MKTTKYFVWFTMVFGTGSKKLCNILRSYKNAAEAYNAVVSGECSIKLSDKELDRMQSVTLETAQKYIEECSRKNIHVLGMEDEDYPLQLKSIAEPPAVLYCRGNLGCLKNQRTVAAVGARKASESSLRATDKICTELASRGFLIVSGFALGTDITAHIAAARAGYPTVCVLGCGVDVDYPKENSGYRDFILQNGGLFVSEYPNGTSPFPGNFPRRNRILSGLGRVTVIFEASAKSGSLNTANHSFDTGKPVFVLPPNDIFSPNCTGNIELLRKNGIMLLGINDILEQFRNGGVADLDIRLRLLENANDNMNKYFVVQDESALVDTQPDDGEAPQLAEDNPPKHTAKRAETKENPEPSFSGELYGLQAKIYDALRDGKLHVDVIADRTGASAEELLTEITEMEILGAIRALPGKLFEICK